MNIELLVTTIVYALSFIITIAFGLVVYLKGSRKITHITFLLMSFSIALFQIGYVFGINIVDGEASRDSFLLSIAMIFVGCFNVHWIISILNKNKEKLKALIFTYGVGTLLALLYIIRPGFLLEPSVPKLYLTNYFVPGPFFIFGLAFFAGTVIYSTFSLLHAYRIADKSIRNKLLYFIFAMFVGFPLGATGLFLVFNISFDPIFSSLFSLYIVPLAYGVLKYDLMDVKLAAKRALVYAVVIGFMGLGIAGINVLDNSIIVQYPNFPEWPVPLLSAIVVALIGGYVWERFRDLDVLKYEFITVVTHRFRTPLTRIKWATEMLRDRETVVDKLEAIQEINHADELLVELTDMLVGLGKIDDAHYLYSFEEFDVCDKVKKIVQSTERRIREKNIDMQIDCGANLPMIQADTRRLQFAIHIVIENSIAYTPKDGKVLIKIFVEDSHIFIQVKDSGIGISKDDIPRMFSKFFRSHDAKTQDTEGMGIGLFMAKQIIERHDGTITVDSMGKGLGTTFTISLPFVI